MINFAAMKKIHPTGILRFFLLASILSLSAISFGSCDKMHFPGYVVYNVDVSDDVFDLFDVYVTTAGLDGEETTNMMYLPFYSASFVKNHPCDARMKIRLMAKSSALHDSIPFRPSFSMWVSSGITTSTENIEDHTRRERNHDVAVTRAGSLDAESFVFRVPLGGSDGSGISARVAPLLYDKKFAFSFRVDGSYVNGWSRIYSLFRGKWIDDEEFLHYALPHTSGYQQDHMLCFTDGCGNDRIFTFTESVNPSVWNQYNPYGIINEESRNYRNPFICWDEIQNLVDMGNGLAFERVDSTRFDEDTPYAIAEGLRQDYSRTRNKVGYRMKVLAVPVQKPLYNAAGEICDLVRVVSTNDSDAEVLDLGKDVQMTGRKFYAGSTADKVEDILGALERQSVSSDPKLVSMFLHRPGKDHMEMFETIYQKYGKAGSDDIWVASLDEIYEYMERRRTAEISSYVKDGYKYFVVDVPYDSEFNFNELSFMVEGASAPAEFVSNNLYGFSSALRADGTVLVNCTFTDKYLNAAYRYLDKYEDLGLSDDRLDAEYLLSLVRPDLRINAERRIGSVHGTVQEDYPFESVYDLEHIRKYIRVYDGYTFTVEKHFE